MARGWLIGAAALLIGGGVLASQGEVLATVAGRAISAAEFGAYLGAVRQQGQYDATLQTLTPSGRARLLQQVVDQRVFAAEARRVKLDADPLVRFRAEQAAAEVLARAYLDARTRELTPGDDDARRYYARHAEEFRTVSRVKARHILLRTRADAEAARAELLAGAAFEQVAAARSLDPTTKDKGGEVGWVPRGLMVKPYEAALFALKAGEISVPVESSFGVHIIRADEIDAGTVPPFEAIAADVKKAMTAKALDGLKNDLMRQYRVTIDKERLAAFGR